MSRIKTEAITIKSTIAAYEAQIKSNITRGRRYPALSLEITEANNMMMNRVAELKKELKQCEKAL